MTMAFAQSIFFPTWFILFLVSKTHLTSYSSVHQESSFISAHIGDKVTLQCFYDGDDSAWIFWYKQSLGHKPKLISSFYIYGTKRKLYNEFNNPRFQISTKNHIHSLTILDLHISDSATYYCAVNYAKVLTFAEGTVVRVIGSGSNIQLLAHQPEYESIQPGGSVTLNCTVQPGSCDGEHSVYWFKDSEKSQPGLIYKHGTKNQCTTNPYIQTPSCVYNLAMENLNASHVGTYYCAVATCGHITFGNGTTLHFSGEANVSMYFCDFQDNLRDTSRLAYATINVQPFNRSQKQRKSTESECVYSSIRHEK
ncbi:uncharacterized protein LOC105925514 [Fundulus heteroclitus]|uniref:uncharacterized protein LOC105925514 n=1 Tax=Fundulus heteroclitus TaxID=8078 RepID=UPI00165C0CFA|nr:uncharacterized protein LOC105925514 [Fundulus heteroclitus]